MLRVAALIITLLANPALADNPQGDVINKHVPNAKLVGKGVYSKVFWDIYQAMLYAPDGSYTTKNPYALSITYFIEADGKDIASRSVDEMKQTGIKDKAKLDDWGMQMSKIFPDIKDGSNLTAIATKDGETLFFSEGKQIGSVSDKDFAPAFFGIWLKPETSDKELRSKLLGDLK